jgi:(p)ppGpp synthase/HD superfamily hydrolase
MIAAVLHDAIEDSDLTLQEIEATFGKVVRDILDGVTRRKGENYLKEFIPRAKAHPGARIIKTADLLHNMSRLHLLSKKDWQRLEKRYIPAKAILNES